MTQQHGRSYEHTLAGLIDDVVDKYAWVTTCGYSGNSTVDDADLVITASLRRKTRFNPVQYNIEAKKRQGDAGYRVIIASGSQGDETGVEEIQRLIDGTPEWGRAQIALKFDRRRVMVIPAELLLGVATGELDDDDLGTSEIEQTLLELSPRTTDSDSISMIKPETNVWPSARGEDDGEYICEFLDIPYTEADD